MITFRELVTALRQLGLNGTQPIIAHASLSAFGPVKGGADTLVGAILAVSAGVMMPTFTYKTMLTPPDGPPNNGITYGSEGDQNQMAEFFHPEMPADTLMGIVAETLRQHPQAQRSIHPIYSFAGIHLEEAIHAQTLAEPFAPIEWLTDSQGVALLLGVDHTANTSIHYAEQRAGRRRFIRWALTSQGIVECPAWPGCSFGFNAITPWLESYTRKIILGNALIQLIPLSMLVRTTERIIAADPNALLCELEDCERCQAVRDSLR